MRHKTPGQHKTLTAFRAHLRALDPTFDAEAHVEGQAGPLGRTLEVSGLALDNRFAIHPMEGWDGTRDGGPTEWTLRRWRRFGQSGAALIWGGEAYAVRPDGRANANQLCAGLGRDERADLHALRESVREGRRLAGLDPDRVVLGLQLTHSGRYARPDGHAAPRVPAHHPLLDARVGAEDDAALLCDDDLRRIRDRYVAAARAAADVGFDFVDVKACHGYLLHELLGARTRPGQYGGDLEGRSRLLLEIVEGVRDACPGLAIGVRLSVFEVPPYAPHPETGVGAPSDLRGQLPWAFGFGLDPADPERPDLAEPLALLDRLSERGVRLVNATAGSPYTCPHVQRPAAYPPSDGYLPPEDPLASVLRQLRAVRELRAARPDLCVVGTGYSYLMEWLPHVAQAEVRAGHVDLVGLGRMVLSYPELPADVLAGRPLDRRRLCRTFSDCTSGPRQGELSGCYPLDEAYSVLPQAKTLRLARSSSGAKTLPDSANPLDAES